MKLHPLRKNSIFGINLEKNFCFGLQDDFAAIVIVWKILEESHYGQLFYVHDFFSQIMEQILMEGVRHQDSISSTGFNF